MEENLPTPIKLYIPKCRVCKDMATLEYNGFYLCESCYRRGRWIMNRTLGCAHHDGEDRRWVVRHVSQCENVSNSWDNVVRAMDNL